MAGGSVETTAAAGSSGAPAPGRVRGASTWLPHITLGAALLAIGGLHAWWISTNVRPPDWDQCQYLQSAITMHRALAERGWGAFLEAVRGSMGIKAPGVALLSVPILAVAGEGLASPIYVNVVLWALGTVYVFLLARRWLPPREAVVAALLAGTMPLSIALARSFFVEAALSTAVVAFVFHAEASERLTRIPHLVALAFWCAVGLLVKVSFPAYVLLPALLSTLTRADGAPVRHVRILLAWAAVTAAGGLVAWSLWYGPNLSAVLQFASSSAYGGLSAYYRRDSFADYVHQLARHGTSLWVLAVLAVLVVAAAWRGERIQTRRALWCMLWIAPPLAAMLLADNGEIRYVAPLLPAIALLIGTLLHDVLATTAASVRRAAAVLVLVPVLVHLGLWSSGIMPRLGADRWVTHGFWYGRYEGPPYEDAWPQEAIVRAIATAQAGVARPPTVAVNVNSQELNNENLGLTALLLRAPIRMRDVPTELPAAIRAAFNAEYVVSLIGGEPPRNGLNDSVAPINEALWGGELPFVLMRTFDAPGGWKLGLFRHECRPSPERARAEPLAIFEGGLALRDLEVSSVRSQPRFRVEWEGAPGLLDRAVLLVEVRDALGRPRAAFTPQGCTASRPQLDGKARQDFLIAPELVEEADVALSAIDAWSGRPLPIAVNAGPFEVDASRTRLLRRGATAMDAAGGSPQRRAR